MIAVIGRLLAVADQETMATGTEGTRVGVGGLAGRIAVAAAADGSRVELIAKLGDDPVGDATLFALTRASVGHAAILRDPSRPTPVIAPEPVAARSADMDDADDEWLDAIEAEAEAEDGDDAARADLELDATGLALEPGDLELALRYLTDLSVVVLADPAVGTAALPSALLADPAASGLVAAAADGAAFAGAALVIIGDPEALLAEGAPQNATILSAPTTDADGIFTTLVAEYAVALDAGKAPAEAWAAATRRIGAQRA